MNELLNYTFLGNPLKIYILSAAIFIISLILDVSFKKFVFRKYFTDHIFAGKFRTRLLKPMLWLTSFYIVFNLLELSESISKTLIILFIISATWFFTRLAILLFDHAVQQYLEKTRSEEDQKKVKPIIAFLNLIIWMLGFLFILNYLGVDVSTALAGLGIGGIAVALAAQAILGDLFSYFVIFFDKPFEIGDFLSFDDKVGSVEKIGIKTTKIRALSGELLIVSNSSLTNSRLHNFKRMERRRILFSFGVVYQTPIEQLKAIPAIIKTIIEESELTQFDRSHFKSYGDSSLDFENVYFVLSSDYVKYMDIQQEINLKIFEKFSELGIDFAYPTQTIFVNKA